MSRSAVVIINGAGVSDSQDLQALVQALLHAQKLQLNGGTLASPSLWDASQDTQEILDAYAAAFEELHEQASDLPPPAEFYSMVAKEGIERIAIPAWSSLADRPSETEHELSNDGDAGLLVLTWHAEPELSRAIQQHPTAKGRIRALDLKARHSGDLLSTESGRQSTAEALMDSHRSTDAEAERGAGATVRRPEHGPDPKDPMAASTAVAELESLDPIAEPEEPAEEALNTLEAPSYDKLQSAQAAKSEPRSAEPSIQSSVQPHAIPKRNPEADPGTARSDPKGFESAPIAESTSVPPDDGNSSSNAAPKSPAGEPSQTPPADHDRNGAEPVREAQTQPATPEQTDLSSEEQQGMGPGTGVENSQAQSPSPVESECGLDASRPAGENTIGAAATVPEPDDIPPSTEPLREAVVAGRILGDGPDLCYAARTAIGLDEEAYPTSEELGVDDPTSAMTELLQLFDSSEASFELGEAAREPDDLDPDALDAELALQAPPNISCSSETRAGADPPASAEGDPSDCPSPGWSHLDI